MIAEREILLRVEHFEQRRRRIAAVVGADLVDLVEHEDRIRRRGLIDALNDAAGQGADVGAAMAADFGLVAHAAERNADELAVERAGDRAAERCLADAGRADEAEDRPLHLLPAQLAHGQVLEDALLDLLEIVVVFVEDRPRPLEIVIVGRHHAPRQAGHPIEIRADDRRLGRVGMRALQPLDLFLDLFAGLRRDLFLFDLLAVVLDFLGDLFSFAELGLDRFQLLAQEVLALRLVHLPLCRRRDLLLHRQQVDLAGEKLVDPLQALDGIHRLEDLLRFFELEVEVRCGQVGQSRRIVEIGGDDHDFGADVLAEADGAIEVLFDGADERLGLQAAILRRRLFDASDLCFEERRGLDEVVDAGTAEALHEDADAAVRQLQHPHDDGHRADAIEVVLGRVFVLKVFLRRQHDDAVLGQRLVHRVDRLLARHRQRDDDERKDHQVLERKHRQDVGDFDWLFFRGFVRVSHLDLSDFVGTIWLSVQ